MSANGTDTASPNGVDWRTAILSTDEEECRRVRDVLLGLDGYALVAEPKGLSDAILCWYDVRPDLWVIGLLKRELEYEPFLQSLSAAPGSRILRMNHEPVGGKKRHGAPGPSSPVRISSTMGELRAELERVVSELSSADTTVDSSLGGESSPRPFAIRSSRGVRLVPIERVLWAESARHYVRLHCRDGSFLIRANMTEVLARMSPDFLRVHRSFIVRLSRIRELRRRPTGHHDVVLDGGQSVPVGRTYAGRLRAALGL